MKLKYKLLLLYLFSSILILVFMWGFLSAELREAKFNTIQRELNRQLVHLDFAITRFIKEAESDIRELSANELVRTTEDDGFTSFIGASEETFEYSFTPTEEKIIDIFNNHRLTHPYINSVYMGRENGSFVRSHKTARVIDYDPRVRPWYVLAKENLGEVVKTAPYRSITQPDVNIGVVTALINEKAMFYGVIGADITLENLTDYIKKIEVGRNGWAIMTDWDGTILSARDEGLFFKNILDIDEDFKTLIEDKQGYVTVVKDGEEGHLFFYTSPYLGWKLGMMIPSEEIEKEVEEFVHNVLLTLVGALILLSVITFMGLQRFVVRPIKKLDDGANLITKTGDLDVSIDIKSKDEFGGLANSFTVMEGELKKHRDHLEGLVTERTNDLNAANRKLEELSITDALTNVYNRRFLNGKMTEEIRRSHRAKRPVSLIAIDIDHFKEINDTKGHGTGDAAIKHVADILKDTVRQIDIVARYGGDEFFIIVPETGREGAVTLSKKIMGRIESAVLEKDGEKIKFTISLGVSTFDGATFKETFINDKIVESIREDLMKSADAALYKAKEQGRNRVCVVGEEII